MNRFIASALTAIMVVSLVGCAKTDEKEKQGSGIPDNTVAPIVTVVPPTEAGDTETQLPYTTVNESVETTSQETKASVTTPEPEDDIPDEQVETSDPTVSSRAMELLALLNSDRVHAKFLELYSMDGENVVSTAREYFVNGDTQVYIDDETKRIVSDGYTTVINFVDMTFYRFETGNGEVLDNFGYGRENYTLISTSEENGEYNEVFEIEGEDIISTWTFESDGSLLVADRNDEMGFFCLYDFDVLEVVQGALDLSVPDGYTEIFPDEDDFML